MMQTIKEQFDWNFQRIFDRLKYIYEFEHFFEDFRPLQNFIFLTFLLPNRLVKWRLASSIILIYSFDIIRISVFINVLDSGHYRFRSF